MSEKQRYENMDSKFQELPLPDEEVAWRQMSELLDKQDKRRRVFPPVFLKSCAGWTLLSFLVLGGIWLFIHQRPEKESSVKNQPAGSPASVNRKDTSTGTLVYVPEGKLLRVTGRADSTGSTKPVQQQTATLPGEPLGMAFGSRIGKRGKAQATGLQIVRQEVSGQDFFDDGALLPPTRNLAQPLLTRELTTRAGAVKDTASANRVVPENHSLPEKRPQAGRPFRLSAGIGEQQQIPIAGQTAVPYSYYGRKGSLSDYIPSVYVRLEKERKWFVQSELRYGAAQSLKEFSYSRKTQLDTSAMQLTTTTLWVKKTYYHQLPLSFNYYVLPRLSVGAGGIYSRFYKAIIEQETETKNIQTGAETNSKQIIPRGFTDSFFYKTQIHLLLEADYEWKRFSFGLRYTKDIQPFIKYTRPDGMVNQKKNQTVQFMLRYRLWQSERL